MRYGLPYQGSKSQIARKILEQLPTGKRLVDLFGGGGAISHCAVLSGKYENVLYNDYNPLIVDLFRRAVNGDFALDRFTPEWVSREDFQRLKDTDGYEKYVWSFGNDGETYIFGKDIENSKRIIFNAVVSGDTSELSELIQKPIRFSGLTYMERRLEWGSFCLSNINAATPPYIPTVKIVQLQSLQSLQRLQVLEGLGGLSVEIHCGSYLDYEYHDGDVVYLDPPYEFTKNYCGAEFNHKEFYDWVYSRPYQVFFSSYDNISDKRFKIVFMKDKLSIFSATSKNKIKKETLYVNMTKTYKAVPYGKYYQYVLF